MEMRKPTICEHQIRRPNQLPRIEPNHASGQQTPIDQREVEIRSLRSDDCLFRKEPRGRADYKPRSQRREIASPAEFSNWRIRDEPEVP
jgi:hypothetical protein